MPFPKDDRVYLQDILQFGKELADAVQKKSFAQFLSDNILIRCVERYIELIGEAAGRVSEQFRNEHPEVPWKKIVAQRNVIAHEYGEIKYERLWAVVIEHIPALMKNIEKIIIALNGKKR